MSEKWKWNFLTMSDLTGFAGPISMIAGVASYFSGKSQNRKIIGLLNDIKKHLDIIETKIDTIFEQNTEILNILDKLPAEIRLIVREELRTELNFSTLNERYSSFITIKNNYFLLPKKEKSRYRVHTKGWDKLSDTLTYLFLHENRLSYILKLIYLCEFAQIATEKRGSGVLLNLLEEKQYYIANLLQDLIGIFNTDIAEITHLLNSEFIDSYQTNGKLSFNMVVDKPNNRYIFRWPTESDKIRRGGWNGEPDEAVIPIRENIEFNKRKPQIKNSIIELDTSLTSQRRKLVEVAGILNLLDEYIDIVKIDQSEIFDLEASLKGKLFKIDSFHDEYFERYN